jgi:hypothetical protein
MTAEPPSLPPKSMRVDLRVANADLRAWREAAVRAKQNLSEWIRQTCDAAIAATKEPKKR